MLLPGERLGQFSLDCVYEITALANSGAYLACHSSTDAQGSGARITAWREMLASIFASGFPEGYLLPLREPRVVRPHLQRFEPGLSLLTQCERVQVLSRPPKS